MRIVLIMKHLPFFSLALLGLFCFNATAAELTLYSARADYLVEPLLRAYTAKTGTTFKLVTDKEGVLVERLKTEGEKSTADLLITVDAGNLWFAAEQGVLKPVKSKALEAAIPANLRDPDGRWFGLSVRARTLVYNTNQVKPSELTNYEDLASPKWKGRLCLRTSKKVYNQSLVAVLMKRNGEAKTAEMLKGWIANLATPVFSDDTKMMEAVAAGKCAVGITNTYYYGRLMKEKKDLPIALFFPSKSKGGVHVNVSGAGLTKATKQEKEATAFLEWLAGPEAQNLYVDANFEYPANPKISPSKEIQAWGKLEPDTTPLKTAGELQVKSTLLMDQAGYL